MQPADRWRTRPRKGAAYRFVYRRRSGSRRSIRGGCRPTSHPPGGAWRSAGVGRLSASGVRPRREVDARPRPRRHAPELVHRVFGPRRLDRVSPRALSATSYVSMRPRPQPSQERSTPTRYCSRRPEPVLRRRILAGSLGWVRRHERRRGRGRLFVVASVDVVPSARTCSALVVVVAHLVGDLVLDQHRNEVADRRALELGHRCVHLLLHTFMRYLRELRLDSLDDLVYRPGLVLDRHLWSLAGAGVVGQPRCRVVRGQTAELSPSTANGGPVRDHIWRGPARADGARSGFSLVSRYEGA